MLKKILLGLAVVIALFLGYVALQPAEYEISRQIAIAAPAEKIFPYLNNSRKALEWSPWAELDPSAKMELSGPEEGVGSRTSWSGGKELGTGSATIEESVPGDRVRIRLEYQEPMEMNQDAEYKILAADTGSVVVWSVRGRNNFMGRVFCAFFNMDKHVGQNFDKGLASLKSLVESGS